MNALRHYRLALSRDKADTLLMLIAALLVLAPHTAHLPLWVSALCATTLIWRAAVTLLGRRMPPAMLLLPLALGAMGGVLASFHTLLGRDAGVAMLVLLVAFKMLEMKARRDLFVVVFLCFFLVLTNFFYAQGIGTALLTIAAIIALLTVQMTFQFTGAVPSIGRRLLMAVKILGLATPVALLLFVVFPRIQGPLWGMPGDANGGKTGLSNTMAPGNLSSLAESDDPAFRVRFIDPMPVQARLYWRGVVLGDFDGRTWTQVKAPTAGAQRQQIAVSVRGARVRHEVTLEPSNNRWLFALDLPDQLPRVPGHAVSVSAELEMMATAPLDQRVRYAAASYPEYALQAGDTLEDSARWLALPDGFNPLTVANGRTLHTTYADPVARVRAVLTHFSEAGFSYTMEPPPLGRDSVDQFLFSTRAGFCEHYSSAFVVLMRAAGVPARVVTGYQGGEPNPVDGVLTVRQSDAHAWTEVWLARRGWVRVDPTAAVSPLRVTKPVKRARAPQERFLGQLGQLMDFGRDPNSWVAQLRFQFAALNNGWSQWVLNYSPERQRGVLDGAGAALLQWRTLLGILAIAGLLFAVRVLRRRARQDPVDALYSALCDRLGPDRHGTRQRRRSKRLCAAAGDAGFAGRPEGRHRAVPAVVQRV